MTNKINSIIKKLAVTTLLAAPFVGSAHATIIDFGLLPGSTNCGNDSGDVTGGTVNCSYYKRVLQSYGDVAGVLDVTYSDKFDASLIGEPTTLKVWGHGYSDLAGVVWSGKGDAKGQSHAQVFLKPEAGFDISLNSLTFGAYRHSRSSIISVLDPASQNSLFTTAGYTISGKNATSFGLNLGSSSSGYIIDWFDSAYNVGLSAIDYTITPTMIKPPVPVSEPGMFALLAAGSLGMFATRRRRKSA